MFFKRRPPIAEVSTKGINFIIVGLGNPGTKYENTRHNCGFMVIDDLARKHGTEVKQIKFKSLVGEIKIGGFENPADAIRCLLMKPSTYMNRSGQAVSEAMKFYKLAPSQLIVLCDDINLDVGTIRTREKGSDGGQKGLQSIIVTLNSDEFARIRIGVGAKPHPDYALQDWVLSLFKQGEAPALEFALRNAVESAEMCVSKGVLAAMNKYNGVKFSKNP